MGSGGEATHRPAVAIAAVVAAFFSGALASSAHAAFPGLSGKIAYVSSDSGRLATAYEDGGGETFLTPMAVAQPQWSADGRRLTFIAGGVWVVDEDGANLTQLTTDGSVENPIWSPDGTRIAFERYSPSDGRWDVYVMSADGTGAVRIGNGGLGRRDPAWSPDGSKIAYIHHGREIRVVSPDGTDDALLVAPPGGVSHTPDWSPDGTRLAFTYISSNVYQIHLVGADGEGEISLTPGGCSCGAPVWSPDGYFLLVNVRNATGSTAWKMSSAGGSMDRLPIRGTAPTWQPIPGITGYPRPKSARTVDTSLVVAYENCIDPNRRHGPPLAEDSCAPPQPGSQHLTVGTADSNRQPTNSVGRVRLSVLGGDLMTPADEADIALTIYSTDVRRAADLSDYTGEVRIESQLRLVDRTNSGSPPAATMVDTTFAFTAPCAATESATIGGHCQVETTADSLVPGTVTEGARAAWQLEQVRVFDGGADEDADTTADNTLFLTQGVLIP